MKRKRRIIDRRGDIEISALGYIVLGVIALMIALGLVFYYTGGMDAMLQGIEGILAFGG